MALVVCSSLRIVLTLLLGVHMSGIGVSVGVLAVSMLAIRLLSVGWMGVGVLGVSLLVVGPRGMSVLLRKVPVPIWRHVMPSLLGRRLLQLPGRRPRRRPGGAEGRRAAECRRVLPVARRHPPLTVAIVVCSGPMRVWCRLMRNLEVTVGGTPCRVA